MPELDLDELERLHAAATPGPWRVESEVVRDSMGLFWPISSIEGAEDNVTENITTGDAAYIVAACNAAPQLIKRLREMDRQMVWLAKQVCDSFSPQEWINRAEQAAKEAGE